jgi:hypothetical protein
VQGFDLPPEAIADIPAAFFAHLKYLAFEYVTIDGATLAGMLSQCPQLEELQVRHTIIRGSTDQLSVLSKLAANLSLTLDVQEIDLPEGAPGLSFLQRLGDCLTSLEVDTWDDWDLDEQLIRVTATHLHRLQHLTINNSNGSRPGAEVFDLLAKSPAAQTLETMKAMITFPDMKSLVKVLTMPKLEYLSEVTFPEPMFQLVEEEEQHAAQDLAGFKFIWPEGKPPMQLSSLRAGITQLTALPLGHFETILMKQLSLPRGASRQERAAALSALMSAAQKCPNGVYFTDFQTHLGDNQAGGLSALQPGCSLKLARDPAFLGFMRIELDESDIKGVVAAYGQDLVKMNLMCSSLTAEAWAAITPAQFPALRKLSFSCPTSVVIPYITALCMDWPAEHPLTVKLSHFDQDQQEAKAVAAHIPKLLAAKRRQNPVVDIS